MFVRVISSLCHAPESLSVLSSTLALHSSFVSPVFHFILLNFLTSTFSSSMRDVLGARSPCALTPTEESGPLANDAPLTKSKDGQRPTGEPHVYGGAAVMTALTTDPALSSEDKQKVAAYTSSANSPKIFFAEHLYWSQFKKKNISGGLGQVPSDHAAERVVVQKPAFRGTRAKRIPNWMSRHSGFLLFF